MSGRGGPLIIQSDHTILLETAHPDYEEARDRLARFAELVKCPDYIHTYRVTRISIWNAAFLGVPLEEITGYMEEASRYPVPPVVLRDVREWYGRFGVLVLEREEEKLLLRSRKPGLLEEVKRVQGVPAWVKEETPDGLVLEEAGRGPVKQALAKAGYPVEDLAGYSQGVPLEIRLRKKTLGGKPFRLRDYQEEAARVFHAGGTVRGGSGVIALPCGAGKTIVALAVMNLTGTRTLVLTTNTVAARQWRREILDKTFLSEEDVGEYSGEKKEIRPVTITTYQMVTHRKRKGEAFTHVDLMGRQEWGLIVYDEVHLLPAQVFRVTASIQARRRLGLTATLVREDGREDEVFSLIGPKRYDVPWKVLEKQGWIAGARCVEVRIPLAGETEIHYRAARKDRDRYRIAAENPAKDRVLSLLLEAHRGDRVLVLGQYLDQLHRISRKLDIPLITGATPNAEREVLYAEFREGRIGVLLVSRVGNFAVDLPEANVAVQVSGTFGSRQEEAQRLGRILRPKEGGGGAVFYSLVTEGSREETFAARRQLFLAEQGYEYEILPASVLEEGGP